MAATSAVGDREDAAERAATAKVSYVEWTSDGLLRHVVYLGERQDKLAIEVRRRPPHADEA